MSGALRGTQVLLQRTRNRDATIELLRTKVAGLEERWREHRFEVHVSAFRFVNMTEAHARDKAKALLDLGCAQFVTVVEDP